VSGALSFANHDRLSRRSSRRFRYAAFSTLGKFNTVNSPRYFVALRKFQMMDLTAVRDAARRFNDRRRKPGKLKLDPKLLASPSVRKAIDGMIRDRGATREQAEDALMRAHNLGEILTVEELASRLKVDPAWIKHRRRSRAKNRIPALDILGRPLRFDWDAVVKWLEAGPQVTGRRSKKRV
jgi:hypothetical protein